MIRLVIKYLAYFIGLLLIQVLVLNNFQISAYLNPYVYILFLILLPFEVPGWLILISGFVLGLTIDVFPQGWSGQGTTVGIHAAATTLVAFLRPRILVWINPRDDYESGSLPGASDYGIRWYMLYVLLMTVIHHFVLFGLEEMSFARIPEVILRTLLSSLFTIFLILVWEAFRYGKN